MDPEYARHYRELYEKHWWWRAREDLILETLDRICPGGAGGPILDVGCGDGLFFEKLERFGPVEGVEMDPTGIEPGGRWAHRIRVQPFDESFEPGKRYALVLMLDVLEHFPEPGRFLRRAVELLREGGAILITVPAFQGLWTSHDVINRHYTRYSRRRLEAVVEEAGGRIEQARFAFQWMSVLKLALHWKERLRPVRPSMPGIPPEGLNRALYRLTILEHRVFKAIPVPFGNSLFAVVRKG